MMMICIALLLFTGLVFIQKRSYYAILWGILLLSNAINLSIFYGSNPKVGMFAFIKANGTADPSNDPLPQALVLTAIVIGFALLGLLWLW